MLFIQMKWAGGFGKPRLPIFLFAFACFSWKNGAAQLANFDRVVIPTEQKAKDFSEYLVQLAWENNPANKVLLYKKEIAEQEVKLAKKDWLNGFNLSGSYSNQPVILTIPRYNLAGDKIVGFDIQPGSNYAQAVGGGIGINLAALTSTGNKKEVARQKVKIAEADIDQQKLAVRAEALTRYQKFRLALEIVKTRAQVEQDTKNTFDLVQQLYRTDEKTFEEYNESATAFHQATEARIHAEADYQLARIFLEEIIGIRWEDVVHPGKDK